MNKNEMGKKIYLLFPQGHFYKTLVREVIREEYELYTLSKSTRKLGKLKCGLPSLFLVNLDTPFKQELQAFFEMIAGNDSLFPGEQDMIIPLIRQGREKNEEIPEPPEHPALSPPLALDQEPETASQQIITLLEGLHAKGQRRYVRFGANNDTLSELHISCGEKVYQAKLSDISSAGISFTLNDGSLLPIGTQINSFSTPLSGTLTELTGQINLRRKMPDQTVLMVAMFNQPNPDARKALHTLIHSSLQKQFTEKIRSLE